LSRVEKEENDVGSAHKGNMVPIDK
jgi:hypothetical protein